MPCPLKFKDMNKLHGLPHFKWEEEDCKNDLEMNFDLGVPFEFSLHLEQETIKWQKQLQILTQYSRNYNSKANIISLISLPLRKHYPPVVLHHNTTNTASQSYHNKINANMNNLPVLELDTIDSMMSTTVAFNSSSSFMSSMLRSERRKERKEEEKELFNDRLKRYIYPQICQPYITNEQFNALQKIISCIGPITYSQPMLRIVTFFPFFGIPTTVAQYLYEVLYRFIYKLETLAKIMRIFHHIHAKYPLMYNLFHISCDLIQQAEGQLRVVDLPYHITQAQLHTLQRKNHLLPHETNDLPQISLSLVFCVVCNQIYSNLEDPHTIYVNNHQYGLRDVRYHFLTETLHCSRTKNAIHNYLGNCRDPTKTLAHVCAIGKIIYFNNTKKIMICPQPDCGMLMCLDHRHDAIGRQYQILHNEFGPGCTRCQRKHNTRILPLLEFDRRYSTPEEQQQYYGSIKIVCQICPPTNEHARIIEEPLKNAFMYPFDNHLCKKCHKIYEKPLRNEWIKFMKENKDTSINDMMQHMKQLFNTVQSNKHTLTVVGGDPNTNTVHVKPIASNDINDVPFTTSSAASISILNNPSPSIYQLMSTIFSEQSIQSKKRKINRQINKQKKYKKDPTYTIEQEELYEQHEQEEEKEEIVKSVIPSRKHLLLNRIRHDRSLQKKRRSEFSVEVE